MAQVCSSQAVLPTCTGLLQGELVCVVGDMHAALMAIIHALRQGDMGIGVAKRTPRAPEPAFAACRTLLRHLISVAG